MFDETYPRGPFESTSVLAHELGHCAMALDESNNSDDGASSGQSDHTNSYEELAIQSGADGIPGTSDDQVFPLPGTRLVHWFRLGLNDPFFEEFIAVDSSNFTRVVQSLPAGHSWATRGNKDVAASLSYLPSSQSLMWGLASPRTQFVSLIQDDINTVEFAGSGLDEVRPTSDDYTIELQFVEDCIVDDADIIVTMESLGGVTVADCLYEFEPLPIPGQPVVRHFALDRGASRSVVRLNSQELWEYNLVLWGDFETGDLSQWSVSEP